MSNYERLLRSARNDMAREILLVEGMMQSHKKGRCFSCHCEERSDEAISVVEGMGR